MQLLLKQDSTNSNLQNAILSFYLRIGMAAGRRMDIVLDDHKSWGKQGKKKKNYCTVLMKMVGMARPTYITV